MVPVTSLSRLWKLCVVGVMFLIAVVVVANIKFHLIGQLCIHWSDVKVSADVESISSFSHGGHFNSTLLATRHGPRLTDEVTKVHITRANGRRSRKHTTISSPPVLLPHSAGCGEGPMDILIGILAAPQSRSRWAREMLRNTWFKLPSSGAKIVIRFIFALDRFGNVPESLIDEADEYGDMIFVNTFEAYKNLFNKVNLFFKWAADFCVPLGLKHVLKTDDDSFVHLPRLVELSRRLPAQRLYFGAFLKGMPAMWRNRTTKLLTGKPLEGNSHNISQFPWYASGAGYMVSSDVAQALGNPPLPLVYQTAEDRATGIALFGSNITYEPANSVFRPWGSCISHAVLLHYQRDPGLLRRRYERARTGDNICGEGWDKNTLCELVEAKEQSKLTCPVGKKIIEVLYAGVGKYWVGTGYTGGCTEGPSALEPPLAVPGGDGFIRSKSGKVIGEEWCVYNSTPSIKSLVEKSCLGKSNCMISHDIKAFGTDKVKLSDPCRGSYKRMLLSVRCE